MKKRPLLALTLWIALTLPAAYAQDSPQWHLPEGAKMRLGKGRVYAWQFSPDGRQLKVASGSGIWHHDTQTGEELDLTPFAYDVIFGAAAFSPDGTTFIYDGGAECGLWMQRQENSSRRLKGIRRRSRA